MPQIVFGLSAASAGTMLMTTALGSIAMKVTAPRVLRTWGYRTALLAAGLLASAALAACALFTADWPLMGIAIVLFVYGFVVSLQFAAYNSVAFADIELARLGAATSLYATGQQLALSIGICGGAAALSAGLVFEHAEQAGLETYSNAFLAIAAVSAGALIWNLRFAADAGLAMSGHRPGEG